MSRPGPGGHSAVCQINARNRRGASALGYRLEIEVRIDRVNGQGRTQESGDREGAVPAPAPNGQPRRRLRHGNRPAPTPTPAQTVNRDAVPARRDSEQSVLRCSRRQASRPWPEEERGPQPGDGKILMRSSSVESWKLERPAGPTQYQIWNHISKLAHRRWLSSAAAARAHPLSWLTQNLQTRNIAVPRKCVGHYYMLAILFRFTNSVRCIFFRILA